MTSLKQLESEVEKIKQRNKSVETDKAWERSTERRAILMLFTYLAVALYLNAIGITNAWLSAIVPTIGFWLSTLTLPAFKQLWLEYSYKK